MRYEIMYCISYGASHLVTATVPIWPDEVKYFQIYFVRKSVYGARGLNTTKVV